MEAMEILLTTLYQVPGYRVVRVLGMVKGSTVRSKHLGKDLLAGLRNLVGGEIPEYTEMLKEARPEAERRMLVEAQAPLGPTPSWGCGTPRPACSKGRKSWPTVRRWVCSP